MSFLLSWWEQQDYKKKVILVKSGSRSRCPRRFSTSFPNHFFFCRKTCILQYPRMASKTWQKTFKWTVHYQEECLWSIFTSSIYCFQYRPECRLPYLVVGCRSCPCNLLRANMNNTQLRYRVRIIWNGVNINTVLQNLVKLDRIEKANCIFEWDPANLQPGQSILIAST